MSVPRARFSFTWRHFALVAIALVPLSVARRAEAQVPVIVITPSSGSWSAGTKVSVSIDYCSPTGGGGFDGAPETDFNDQNAGFSYAPRSKSGCDAHGVATGTVTIVQGSDTLYTDVTSTNGGDNPTTAVYVGTAPPSPDSVPPVVTPHAQPYGVLPENGASFSFSVLNPNTVSVTDTVFFTTCSGVASSCAIAGSTKLSVGANQTVSVGVAFNVTGTFNQTGTVTLKAQDLGSSKSDTGHLAVVVAPGGPVVARDLCLTIAVGSDAAYECGDLRIVHPLPSVRTLGKVRTPTLVYNSQHAYPFPSLNDDVTLGANSRPDSIIVIARLKVGGSFVQRDRRAWAGSQWGAVGQAATRRVMTNFGASDLATGFYAFQLEIDSLTSGVSRAIRTDTGTVAIVNRFSSPFGAGWWLDGFEQLLFPADSSLMWVGGDGSVRRYVKAGTWSSKTWYVARPVDGPDTLSFDGTTYIRYLKGGATVRFNTSGFHTQTVNRLGYSTVFAPDASNRLSTITVPPSGSGLTYTFTYGGANGTLSSVAAPDSLGGSSRSTSISQTSITGGARIASITDPGVSASVQFAYANGSYAAAITSRADRRGNSTSYTLGTGLKLVGDSLPVPGAQTIVRTFCPAEIRVWTCGSGLTAPESTYTIYDGPRTDSADVTHFWLDSLGAVTQIRDAYNHVTTLARADTRWPELATRVQSSSGNVVAATYDARGNLAAVADSNPYDNGQNPTTQYTWNQTWDQLMQITLPNSQLTQFGVDTTNGNRLWVQDARGTVSRTTFQYYTSGNGTGLLSTVIPPLGTPTTVAYDGRGNTVSVRAPLGDTTFVQNDTLGRTLVVRTPIANGQYRSDSTVYGAADRVVRSASYASQSGNTQLLTVYNTYDAEGNRYEVQRTQSPDSTFLGWLTTQWTFDAANRPTVEIAPDGFRDSTWYDPAGNVSKTKTRNGQVLTMVYDRMNRLDRRVVPPVTYPADSTVGFLVTLNLLYDNYPGRHPYPWFPNNGSGLLIHADTASFAYDSGGRLIRADNGDARVHRAYFKDGSLQIDSLWIRDYGDTSFSNHQYILKYAYDLNGRPTALHHPAQLAIGTGMTDSVRYVYNDTTGDFATLYTLLGNQIGFLHNMLGELVRTTLPGGIVDSLVYDSLGRVKVDRVANGSSASTKDPDNYLRYTSLWYADPVHTSYAYNTHGWKDTVQTYYSGLGYLSSLGYGRPSNISDSALYVADTETAGQSYHFDPLGNAYWSDIGSSGSLGWGDSFSGGSTGSSYFHNGTGRADSTGDAGGWHYFVYDSAGNTVFFYQPRPVSSAPMTPVNDRRSYYGADGRLRVAEWREAWSDGRWLNPAWQVHFEEYRYDALGRRVLVMDRQACYLGYDSTAVFDCQMSRVRRTVWDGARELWEIQMPARTQDSLLVENDTAAVTYWAGARGDGLWSDPNPLFGRVAYSYAGGVDHPVSLTRVHLARRKSGEGVTAFNPVELEPNWNWRGEAEIGTFSDGGMETCTNGTHCVFVQWRGLAFGVGLVSELLWTQYNPMAQSPYGWFGTLINNKEDGTGTFYRRNRYVDPMTGRFTQEDPIGLAGGLNLYGFAGGDPVNFSDPFGLCPKSAGGDGRTDSFADCLAGSSGWYAYRMATGQGSSLLNELGGVLSSCGESWLCQGVLTVASLGGSALEGAAERGSLGVLTTGEAGARASTAFGRTVQSLKTFLSSGGGPWTRVSAHAEAVLARAYRGATSIEEIFENPETGERIVRHTIVRGEELLHETFRPYAKY